MTAEEKFLAKYLRLSVEDGDVVQNDAKAESDSISHQRDLIAEYLRDKQLYPNMQPLEFVDDGYSGTNFERPAVSQMLSMVRERKICCIIVKDISRFGRNYLKVGDYLEQIFPFMGVRFIAINDGYDSDDYIGTTGGIEIALKSLLYDMYSKDLSKKMRSSLLVRRKRGDFIGPRAPFGYQFSNNKKVLAVDDAAAKYVKRVFQLAIEGYKTGEIAKKLNEEKVPTPGQYKNQKKLQYHIMDGEGRWDSGKVRKILTNKVYLGTVVNRKSEVTTVESRRFRQVPDEEQICVPDRHEALVTEQEFFEASKIIKNLGGRKGKVHNAKQENLLPGKARCGSCKILMAYGEKRDTALSVTDHSQVQQARIALEKKRDSIKVEKQYIYEQFKRNQIERKVYLRKIEVLRAEESRLCEEIQKMREEKKQKITEKV